MIEKIRAIYNRALLRPMIYMATNRFLRAAWPKTMPRPS